MTTAAIPYRTPLRRHARQSMAASLGTEPLWAETAAEPVYRPLTMHVACDTCVIGAGMAGLTAAYLLSKAGRRVVVIDAGGGETRRTTGHLTYALDGGLASLEQTYGPERMRLAALSHAYGLDLIERIVAAEGIACEFERVPGYLVADTSDDAARLELEIAAAHRAGFSLVGAVEPGTFGHTNRSLIRYPNQGQLHPLKFLNGLVEAIERLGGRFFRARAVDAHEPELRAVRTTNGLRIDCERTVIATNCPFDERHSVSGRVSALRTYVVGFRMPTGHISHALLWDTAAPYHYARVASSPDPEYEVLLVGGEDHRTGEDDDGIRRFAKLEQWAQEQFPGLGRVCWRWSGQIVDPVDSLGYAGPNPWDADQVFLVAGASGNGLTHGALGGHLVAERIMGRTVEWADLYDPRRRPLRSAPRLAREALHITAKFGAHFTPGDVPTRDDIPAGSGAVIREGLGKIAVFRDALGELHECSANCTHLGCVVRWNSTEQSWDCPCHGSRFAVDGTVLNGPALVPLHTVDTPLVPETARSSSASFLNAMPAMPVTHGLVE